MELAWQIMIYTAGFPCQPYSVLSSSRRMLADSNSRQLWAVLRNIKDGKPYASWLNWAHAFSLWNPHPSSPLFVCVCDAEIALLENVLGFFAVLDTVLAVIQRNFREYFGPVGAWKVWKYLKLLWWFYGAIVFHPHPRYNVILAIINPFLICNFSETFNMTINSFQKSSLEACLGRHMDPLLHEGVYTCSSFGRISWKRKPGHKTSCSKWWRRIWRKCIWRSHTSGISTFIEWTHKNHKTWINITKFCIAYACVIVQDLFSFLIVIDHIKSIQYTVLQFDSEAEDGLDAASHQCCRRSR